MAGAQICVPVFLRLSLDHNFPDRVAVHNIDHPDDINSRGPVGNCDVRFSVHFTLPGQLAYGVADSGLQYAFVAAEHTEDIMRRHRVNDNVRVGCKAVRDRKICSVHIKEYISASLHLYACGMRVRIRVGQRNDR